MILKKMSICDFEQYTDNKNIVCYGAGNELVRILKNHLNDRWVSQIVAIADSDDKKSANRFNLEKINVPIITLEKLKMLSKENIILLVTSSAYIEIIENLNEISEFNNIECFIYHYMFGIDTDNSISIRTTEIPLIPKVIHYCWFGKGELPDLYKRCIDSWKTFCPDYEIKIWDESNCDVNEIEFTKQAYTVKKYGFVPDFFRLKIIYENGGIYLDTDVELLKSLDDLRYNYAFCGMQFPGEIALGLGFGSVKGNAIIKEMMRWYEENDFIINGKNNEIPSPIIQTECMHKNGMNYGNKMQIVDDFTVYPVEVLSPKNVSTHEINITKNTYAIHHYDGSWVTGSRKKMLEDRKIGAKKISQMFT